MKVQHKQIFSLQPHEQAWINKCDFEYIRLTDAKKYGSNIDNLTIIQVSKKGTTYNDHKALMYFHGGGMIIFDG